MKMADFGMPWASAVRAITRASINSLCAAPPVKIRRGATSRSYSRTPSVVRANCSGVGFPSESAGVPKTMMASKRVRWVFDAGAKARAKMAHAISAATSTAPATRARLCPLHPRRERGNRWCCLRAGACRRTCLVGCVLTRTVALQTPLYRGDHGPVRSRESEEYTGVRLHQGLLTLLGWMALRAKIRPDEAESEGCGGSTVEDENEVWPDFRRNPSGRGQFSPFRCQSSLADTRYASLLTPRTEKNWLPAPPPQ